MSNPILIPLLNPNEPEALVTSLLVTEGQAVTSDDLLCTLETTKSTADVHAEAAGFVVALQVAEGEVVRAGDLLCYLAESPDWQPPEDAISPSGEGVSKIPEGELPEGVRITQPALRLAQARGLALGQLPVGLMITENMVRSLLAESGQPELSVPESDFDPTAMIIYGCGGHGKACLDLLRSLGTYRVTAFVDDGVPAGTEIMGLPVLGDAAVLPDLRTQGVRQAINAVGGIGNMAVRIKVFRKLADAGFVCPPIVHPTAFVETSASLSAGVQVFPHAYVGSEVQVGFGSIINTGAIVSHDCILDSFVNISPGAILAGEVTCGERVLIGMGATINLLAKVGTGARIGNGATVKSDVPENGIVRAGGIWPA